MELQLKNEYHNIRFVDTMSCYRYFVCGYYALNVYNKFIIVDTAAAEKLEAAEAALVARYPYKLVVLKNF